MEFKIEGSDAYRYLHIFLKAGESFKAEAGAMVSMSENIKLEAKTTGKGILGSLKATIGGESFFASLFTSEGGPGEIILAPSTPGDIVHFKLENKTIFAERGAYLAGSPELDISAKGSMKAVLAGEGLFLAKISGSGDLFLNSYGTIIERTLNGDAFIVDSGHIVAFEEGLEYKLKKSSKGLFSTLASGEGIVAEFRGYGKLWIQSRNLPALAKLLSKYINVQ